MRIHSLEINLIEFLRCFLDDSGQKELGALIVRDDHNRIKGRLVLVLVATGSGVGRLFHAGSHESRRPQRRLRKPCHRIPTT